jgi:sugar transferase (PEP-CTERM/EpsH1 system associated)
MPREIRILHVLHSFSPGGLENGVVNIINRSPRHFEHELCVLSKGREFLQRFTRPVVCHELNKSPGNSLGIILRLRDLFRKRKPDIVHTRNWAAFDAVLAACLVLKPALVHGEHGRDISDPEGLVFRRNLTRRLSAIRAQKYVAVSKDLYGWLNRTVRVPERKLALIPNGVDTERFCKGDDPELRAELGIERDEFVVGTVGRLDPIKNHEGLIDAIALLKSKGQRVRLVIVGEGPNRPRVERGLRAASLDPRPLLLGYRADVERLYHVFDVFVLNSFAEGMSNTLLEAMSSSLPIICTAVGGNVDLVADRQRGMLVRPGDDAALAEALNDYINLPTVRATHAHNARQFIVENYALGRMIDSYVALYESVA